MAILQATVPPGAEAGDMIPIIDPATGQEMEVAVPAGLQPGQSFSFTTTAHEPQVAVAIAMPAQPVQPMQPAEQHIHHYHHEEEPQGMMIDRGDPEYLDASEVAGCWCVLDTCGCCPGFDVYEALSPDELKTGDEYCLFVIPVCNDALPIWNRAGPRIWRHPDLGEMHFNGPDRQLDTCAVKVCRC